MHARANPAQNIDLVSNLGGHINDHKIDRLGDLLPWNWSPLPTALPEAAR